MRLRNLLIILGVALVALIAVLVYFYWPFVAADRPIRTTTLTLNANPTSLKANNTDLSTLTATLSCGRKYNNVGVTVNFTTTLGTLSASSAVTNSSCQATTKIKSTAVGTATVTAIGAGATGKTTVTFTDPNDTSVFSDDFSGTLATLEEKWNGAKDEIIAWSDGDGTIALENGELSMTPKVATSPTITHAPLIIAGEYNWGDYIFESRMKTVSQLRTGSAPNAWEVGWLLFRYTDEDHFYYFIHKPNGIELGKEILNSSGQQDQQYLVTKTSPTLTLGQWNNYKVVLKGANIKVYINDVLVADYTDNSNPYLAGKIGLYNEDAHTHHDDVKVTAN